MLLKSEFLILFNGCRLKIYALRLRIYLSIFFCINNKISIKLILPNFFTIKLNFILIKFFCFYINFK